VTWTEWWESEMRRIFDAWRNRLTPEEAAQWRQAFEAKHPWATARDSYGIKSHNTFTDHTRNKP
jgi:hypothetical protein